MQKHLAVFLHFIKQSLMYLVEYRFNFIIWALVSLMWSVITIAFFEIIYSFTDVINGWTKPMMYVFQGTYFIINFIIWGLLWQNMETLPRKISKGELDLLITKPVSAQFILSFREIDPSNMADLFIGIAAIAYGFQLGGFAIHLTNLTTFLVVLLVAGIFFYSAWFTTVCLSFWADRLHNIPRIFPGLRQLWRIPHSFYSGVPNLIFTYLIPVTIAATVPAQALLGILSAKYLAILVIFSVLSLIVSHLFFQHSLKQYTSASS